MIIPFRNCRKVRAKGKCKIPVIENVNKHGGGEEGQERSCAAWRDPSSCKGLFGVSEVGTENWFTGAPVMD